MRELWKELFTHLLRIFKIGMIQWLPMNTYEKSLELHKLLGGKLEIKSKVPLTDCAMLTQAYSPGVAAACQAIAADPAQAKELTIKKNTVLVVSDGSAVLGLGNLGPLAAIPVMEGKAAIFKEFGGINAFPLCLDTQDTETIIATIKLVAPVFGGVNLEDFSAPRCFEIEERLRRELSIPVMHDDQWGAATVTLAALLNANKVRGGDISKLKIVLSGVGAAGVATGRLLLLSGITDITFCDSKGIIHSGRKDLTKEKKELLNQSTANPKEGTLADALSGADVFIGLSAPKIVTGDMVRSMAERPIVFGLANPTPEIMPEEAKEAGAFIVATGRSDFPNQINNSLVFPGLFKAMLEKNIPQFRTEMFLAVADALAKHVKEPTPEHIIPSMFEKGVVETVYNSVS